MGNEQVFTRLGQLGLVAAKLSELPGDMAEMGVYTGDSAKVIAQAAPHKSIHLFDTFTGIDESMLGPFDLPMLKGMFNPNFDIEAAARDTLKDCPNAQFHVGVFPETAKGFEANRYCLVHLDCDTYNGHRDGLGYFWPRMVVGGLVILHDYKHVHCVGATRAVDEFCAPLGIEPVGKPYGWTIWKTAG